MGRFTKNIQRAHAQRTFQKRTEKFFRSLITEFINFCTESSEHEIEPAAVDAKIDSLDARWQEYVSRSPHFTAEAKDIFRLEIKAIIDATKERIEAQVGAEGTPGISKN